ncbi:MAG: glycosyltransferase family 1 protein [Candidatus Omnitrophica bacterium]|nr:glycosyltransferase family 1 protein [Candidatus Omnitrophota bacterium]
MMFNARMDLVRDKIGVFWGTQGFLPFRLPEEMKAVITVYDLVYKRYPGTLNWDNKVIFPLLFKNSLLRADKIIAISKSTKDELLFFFPFLKGKTEVIYPATEMLWRLEDKKESFSEEILKKLKIQEKRYLLTVSTIEPRKNISNLLKAYAELKKQNVFHVPLLVVGKYGWKSRGVYRLCKKLNLSDDEVIFTGHVSDAQLLRLYQAAELFISVSLYEGFGLPLTEAMACGIPVVASDIPVFREILDNAAVFVDPLSPEGISDGILRVLNNHSLRKTLTQAGIEQMKLLSREDPSLKMLDIFNSFRL